MRVFRALSRERFSLRAFFAPREPSQEVLAVEEARVVSVLARQAVLAASATSGEPRSRTDTNYASGSNEPIRDGVRGLLRANGRMASPPPHILAFLSIFLVFLKIKCW